MSVAPSPPNSRARVGPARRSLTGRGS
jgi:hypothetical protein